MAISPEQALDKVFEQTKRLAEALAILPDDPQPWLEYMARLTTEDRAAVDQYLGMVAISFWHLMERITRLRYTLRAKGGDHAGSRTSAGSTRAPAVD